MIGFLIGTVCLIGLVKVFRLGRHGYGGGCGGGHGYGHRHGRGWRGFGRGAFLRGLFERLETTPGQEKVIMQAAEELQAAFQKLRPASKGLEDLAAALRAESFDEGSAAKFSVEAEETFGSVRTAVLDALRKVHEVLDARQRGILAEMLERRGGFFGGGFGGGGPFRQSAWV
jgi:hypothetical protein